MITNTVTNMAVDTLRRYVWLIELLERRHYADFDEIRAKWMTSSLNTLKERLPKRTFRNHINAIADQFGIDIKFEQGRGYYIDNPEDLSESRVKQNIVSSLITYNTLSSYSDVKDRILLEDTPKNQELISEIAACMHEGCSYSFNYRRQYTEEELDVEVIPYSLKLFKNRWYLLGKDLADEELKIYALDRMSETGPLFVGNPMPKDFDAAGYFSNYYGAIVEGEPEIIKLKVSPLEAKYLRNLPLHHSQEEIETTDDYSIFRLFLSPTLDFKREILSRTDQVEVLEPESLREWMREMLGKLAGRYYFSARSISGNDND